jgi:hypothetical protein
MFITIVSLQAAKKAAAATVVPPIDSFSLSELEGAARLLQAEVETVVSAMGHAGVAPEEYADTWQVSGALVGRGGGGGAG